MPLSTEHDKLLEQLGRSTATGSAGDEADRQMSEMSIRAQISAADALEVTAKLQTASSKWVVASVLLMLISIVANIVFD